jgi:putative transcriptional regulator
MAVVRVTLDEVKARAAARAPKQQAAFKRRMRTTTEAEIARHMVEDGEDPASVPKFEPVVSPKEVRKKLGMTQTQFSALLRIPTATLRNWEQNRFVMEPAAQTLLNLIDREPEAVLRALRGPRAV